MPNSRKPNPPRKSRTPQSSQRHTAPQRRAPEPSGAPELIDPRWILKALAIVLATALLLSWGSLCLLWYQGQWQLVLHPSRNVATAPDKFLFPCSEIHFFDDATGQPQLNGWICPNWDSSAAHAEMLPATDPNVPTVLLLHGANGSMSDMLPTAFTLHKAHLNVLLFDYRGYGHSTGRHPTENSMQQDAEGALNYLVSTQHVSAQKIVLYGQGIGASLAVQLAAQHHDVAAVILDAPDGDLTDRVAHDAHSFLVPARLLFHEQFPLAAPLHTLTTPKLLISYGTAQPPATLKNAADPKTTIEFPTPNDAARIRAIQRFVDLYLHTSLAVPYPQVHLPQPIQHTYPPS